MVSKCDKTAQTPCDISKTHVADVAWGEGFLEETDMGKYKALPAMPFYTGDWMKNPEIRSMPKSYRADCMDIWCYMWNSGERGYLVDKAGNPYSKEELGLMLGYGENSDEFNKFFDYVSRKEIFNIRKKDGAWYSGFIVKLVEISEKRAKAGKKGGQSKSASKMKANTLANTEYEYENDPEYKSFIINFWDIYPIGRKTGKPTAFEKWKKIINKIPVEKIKKAVEKYRDWVEEEEQQPRGPCVWLNNGCWDDELAPLKKGYNYAAKTEGASEEKNRFNKKYAGVGKE